MHPFVDSFLNKTYQRVERDVIHSSLIHSKVTPPPAPITILYEKKSVTLLCPNVLSYLKFTCTFIYKNYIDIHLKLLCMKERIVN